jgi:hypothetical protein
MKLGAHRVALVVLVLAACATAPRLTAPLGEIPDLRGTWRGTWGGTPLALLVVDQGGTAPTGGVMLGPWSLSGQELPALSGVLTFQSAGTAISVNVQGWLGDSGERLTLVLDVLTPNGARIVLTVLTPDRLRGTGTSLLGWEPRGPVELRRSRSRGAVPAPDRYALTPLLHNSAPRRRHRRGLRADDV